MKQQIYQNGFYFMLGIILSALFGMLSAPIKKKPLENTIKIEIVKDSAKVISKDIKVAKALNESNLKEELHKHNIPHANIVLAQAKLESGNFKSNLVQTHQNIFGLKKGNKYRKYSHWTECVADYKSCISNRYTGGDYYAFLNRIGYASHPNYTKLLKDIA